MAYYAPHLVDTEAQKCEEFERGLHQSVYKKVAPLHIRDYAQLVHRVMIIEGLSTHNDTKTKAHPPPHANGNDNQPRAGKKQKTDTSNGDANTKHAVVWGVFKRINTEDECRMKLKTWFIFGKAGYFAKYYPQRKTPSKNQPSN